MFKSIGQIAILHIITRLFQQFRSDGLLAPVPQTNSFCHIPHETAD